ncbi:MAG: hypothetical protein R2746_10070 [Acidimicrobiales bacterium]
MSRSRFGWLVGLSLGFGLVAALAARVVHGRRTELGARRRRPVRLEPPQPYVPLPTPAPRVVTVPVDEADPAPLADLAVELVVDAPDDVVIDLVEGTVWVKPVEGACPEGYPVKAKLSSGIFHLPGMAAYGRTTPDRCYASAEDALADGLRAAKR